LPSREKTQDQGRERKATLRERPNLREKGRIGTTPISLLEKGARPRNASSGRKEQNQLRRGLANFEKGKIRGKKTVLEEGNQYFSTKIVHQGGKDANREVQEYEIRPHCMALTRIIRKRRRVKKEETKFHHVTEQRRRFDEDAQFTKTRRAARGKDRGERGFNKQKEGRRARVAERGSGTTLSFRKGKISLKKRISDPEKGGVNKISKKERFKDLEGIHHPYSARETSRKEATALVQEKQLAKKPQNLPE